MKAKKLFALLLVLAMVVSLFPAVYAAEDITFWDLRNTENVSKEVLSIKLDGEGQVVTRYWGHYYDEDEENQLTVGPGKYGPKGERDDLQINIYVPEGATSDSAVMFLLNNGSWAQNGFPSDTIVDGGEYDSTQNDRVSLALKYNMIVVSYGARCRGSVAIDDASEYVGHSPATIADSKAAIRYVKYNIELGNIPGDADKVVISGHSGGGALGSILASTGNSSDFDDYLVNAAPATDDVFAVMASAPITDLAYADFAYEWTFGDYRAEAPYDSLSYGEYDETMMALSETLAAKYVTYVADMFGLTEEEYIEKIADIMEASVQHEIDLDAAFQYAGADGVDLRPADDERGWYKLDADGNVVEGSWDLEAYTTWLINNAGVNKTRYSGNELKGIMAFNSEGMENGYMRNENNLWGTTAQAYSIAYPELWDLLKDPAAIGVDKYADFEEFWAAEGALVGKQMKMVSVMPYLTGSENMWYLEGMDDAGDEADIAPNWFIRHGFGDADTSYAVVASLMLAVEEAAEGEVNAYFGWERNHNQGGSTYYQEFFQWMEDNGWIEEDPGYTLTSDIPYVENANEYQKLDLYVPDGNPTAAGWPVYIYVHGGGFTKGDKAEAGSSLNASLAALEYGYVVAAVNYTVTGEKTEDAIHDEIVDVKAAIRYLKANAEELGIDPDRIVLAGPSAGGGLSEIVGASWNSTDFEEDLAKIGAAEADDKVAAVVSYAGAGDFDGIYPKAASDYFDAEDPAMFLRHGDVDPIVACSVSEAIAAAAEKAGIKVNFEAVKDAKHTFQNFFALYDVADTFKWLANEVFKPVVTATNQTITVNGQKVAPEAYNVNGENYFKLRDIAALLNGTSAQFSVEYIANARAIYIVTGEKYVAIGGECVKGADKSATCVPTNQSVIIDALASYMKAYNFDGANYFRLKDLGAALGFDVDYNAASRTVIIETK